VTEKVQHMKYLHFVSTFLFYIFENVNMRLITDSDVIKR